MLNDNVRIVLILNKCFSLDYYNVMKSQKSYDLDILSKLER